MSEKQKFINYMEKQGFNIHENFMGFYPLIPLHQKTTNGDHVLIKEIIFTNFDGSNTKKGDLGCLVFYYHGKKRKKYKRTLYQAEILKKSFCPKNAKEAIEEFDKWYKETKKIRKQWKIII